MNNIDILEELVSAYKDCFVENYNEMIVDVGMRYKDIQAITTLIAENKEKDEEIENQDKTIDKLVKEQEEREKYTHQLEAENKELKEENNKLTSVRNWYFEHYTAQACTPEILHKILKFDYIPKSKVVEELKKAISEEIDTSKAMFEGDFTNGYIFALQSLLGKE